MPYKDRSNSDLAQLDRHGTGNTTIIAWWVQSPSEILAEFLLLPE